MLDIIGAGFGRTGTLSLKTALERLGFGPCYHAIEALRHPSHLPRWEAAAAGHPDWEHVFAGYRATVDWPGVHFWRELIDANPTAKVVLTVRDPRRWHASVRDTFLTQGFGVPQPAGDDPPPFLAAAGWSRADSARQRRLMGRIMGDFFDRIRDEESAVAEFERHVGEVQGHVPADRLLVYEVAQGWEPLCEFLGVETPREPFPRLNDKETFKDLIPRLVSRTTSDHG